MSDQIEDQIKLIRIKDGTQTDNCVALNHENISEINKNKQISELDDISSNELIGDDHSVDNDQMLMIYQNTLSVITDQSNSDQLIVTPQNNYNSLITPKDANIINEWAVYQSQKNKSEQNDYQKNAYQKELNDQLSFNSNSNSELQQKLIKLSELKKTKIEKKNRFNSENVLFKQIEQSREKLLSDITNDIISVNKHVEETKSNMRNIHESAQTFTTGQINKSELIYCKIIQIELECHQKRKIQMGMNEVSTECEIRIKREQRNRDLQNEYMKLSEHSNQLKREKEIYNEQMKINIDECMKKNKFIKLLTEKLVEYNETNRLQISSKFDKHCQLIVSYEFNKYHQNFIDNVATVTRFYFEGFCDNCQSK